MNIKITADSTCDLSEELLRQWNISLMPMHILMGDDTYLDGVTIHPADVFAHVDAGGQTPKSAAANPVEYIDFFEPFAKEYDAVIHISVSAKLSSCYQNACLAAQEYDNVSVIDSENICTGQGYLVLRAAKWAADGLTARNICMRLQNLAKRVELSFVLDQLNYMAKSGRCSGVLAFGANILDIKPSLAIIGERYGMDSPEGRGVLADPALGRKLKGGSAATIEELKKFHDVLYAAYCEEMSGDRTILYKMKEMWFYLHPIFTDGRKYFKKIKKCEKCVVYESVVKELFLRSYK